MSSSRLGASGDAFISPNFTASDWKNLNMSSGSSQDWDSAIKMFHDRLDGRFLAPVEAIRNHSNQAIQEYSGFAIVAIDCLLIETIGQFYHGFDETPSIRPSATYPQRKNHKDFYMQFLGEIASLAKDFDTPKKKELFYKHFRCGILHQAQTKKKSRVRYGEREMVAFADTTDEDQDLILDRNRLHDALVKEISEYETRLVTGTVGQLRANFIKKMDFIAR